MPPNTAPDDVTLAQMRAEMLRRFDDGASLLGQDPNMLQVGLFGRGPKPVKPAAPPVNLGRRGVFGLPEMPANVPAVTPQQPVAPQPIAQPAPPQPVPQPSVASPLQQAATRALNAPVSRRQVLQRAGSAALQQVLPTPKVADVVKEVASPLVEATPSAISGIAPGITAALRGLLKEQIENEIDYGNEGLPDLLGTYLENAQDIDPSLKDTIKQDLDNYRQLADEDSEDAYDAEYEVTSHFDPVISHMPGDAVLKSLSETTGFYDYLNDAGIGDLVKRFRKEGATKENVLDFLDTHFPGFDASDADTLRMIDDVYAKPMKSKKRKD